MQKNRICNYYSDVIAQQTKILDFIFSESSPLVQSSNCIQSLDTVYCTLCIIYITAAITAFQYDGGMRLLDGPQHSQGILELHFFGQWGGVCGQSFDLIAADAACVALGYSRSRSFHLVSRYEYNCDCLSENPPSLHLPVFQEIPF